MSSKYLNEFATALLNVSVAILTFIIELRKSICFLLSVCMSNFVENSRRFAKCSYLIRFPCSSKITSLLPNVFRINFSAWQLSKIINILLWLNGLRIKGLKLLEKISKSAPSFLHIAKLLDNPSKVIFL